MSIRRLRLVLIFLFASPVWAVDVPRVVVSITPLHSLVVGVMEGVAEPELLVKGNNSPHGYMLRPSQVRSLQQADVIVWVGEGVEDFLARPLGNLDSPKTIIKLMDVEGMRLLATREGGVWQVGQNDYNDGDQHGHRHNHNHNKTDGHLWLDPENAILIVQAVVEQLSLLDSAHAPTYKINGEKLQQELIELNKHLEQRLAVVRQIPYLVFHDAYHYFEHAYGLNPIGVIMIDLDHKPGARRLTQIRLQAQKSNIRCVFGEPQFPDKLVSIVTEGTSINSAKLDPMGLSLQPGKSLYFDLMRGLAENIVTCFEKGD